ncbi:MAG: exodeoxyribonuclease VII small subunit [Oscillospiraceae bacterium]|jgi:exodeoxyribonuclease VII small subunit|nr:exodeoxyribonuclease VII small subunit [Oscillospiraceae bacterium]
MAERLNFEQALSRLAEISATMNDQNLPLEESLKLYGEAVGLIDICKRRIETAKLTVEKIENESAGGEPPGVENS